MVMVAACLGLRASEIMGLQWGDFNWEDLTVLIRRGVVNGRTGDTKTEASQKPLPVDRRLAHSLEELWKRSSYKNPQDWVFSNRTGRPRAQQDILRRHLRSAALRAGIGKIGWHTFRHSYSTMLRGAGTDIKVQQELLRHATIQSTMNIYTQPQWSPQNRPTVVRAKPANGKRPGTQLFYPATSCAGKSIFVRQLRGPHLST